MNNTYIRNRGSTSFLCDFSSETYLHCLLYLACVWWVCNVRLEDVQYSVHYNYIYFVTQFRAILRPIYIPLYSAMQNKRL